jgi:hypothetical protein
MIVGSSRLFRSGAAVGTLCGYGSKRDFVKHPKSNDCNYRLIANDIEGIVVDGTPITVFRYTGSSRALMIDGDRAE